MAIRFELNGQPIAGWDTVDDDHIDLAAAAINLTDWQEGDRLTAILSLDGVDISRETGTLTARGTIGDIRGVAV